MELLEEKRFARICRDETPNNDLQSLGEKTSSLINKEERHTKRNGLREKKYNFYTTKHNHMLFETSFEVTLQTFCIRELPEFTCTCFYCKHFPSVVLTSINFKLTIIVAINVNQLA